MRKGLPSWLYDMLAILDESWMSAVEESGWFANDGRSRCCEFGRLDARSGTH
jgi:hypothetical protein